MTPGYEQRLDACTAQHLQLMLAACRVTLQRYLNGVHKHGTVTCAFCTALMINKRAPRVSPSNCADCAWSILEGTECLSGFAAHAIAYFTIQARKIETLRVPQLRDQWIPAIEDALRRKHPSFCDDNFLNYDQS